MLAMVDGEDTNKRLEEARLAMEDEAHRLRRKTKEEELTKLRRAAQLAMEGEAHRHKRELEERQIQLEKLAAEKRATEVEAAKQAEEQARLAAEAAEEQQLSATANQRRSNISSVTTASEAIAKLKNLPIHLSPLRTFKTDMAEAVKSGLSVARMALSEQGRKRGVGEAASTTPTHKTHWSVIVILLLVVLGAVGVTVWRQNLKGPLDSAPTTVPSPIFVESSQAIPVDRGQGLVIATAIDQTTKTLVKPGGQITQLYFTENKTALSFPQFILKAGWQPPESLSRNLGNNFLFGLYWDGEQSNPFIVFETTFFERAWDGMFQWEPGLWNQLWPFLKLPTETAPPTPQVNQFQDKIIRNKDARILLDNLGQVLLAYSFLDNRHILITRTETAFIEVLKRFIAK